MDAAALVLLISGVGVGFGWRPMPDNSQRYEYVVQIEPELAATLADGQAIPLVGEVPEDIHPIGRVRVVVGRGDPPRHRMVTQLKPAEVSEAAGAKPDNAIELAQYSGQRTFASSSDADRYAAAAADWNGGDGTAVAPTPRAAQPIANPAAGSESSWNDGSPAPQIGPNSAAGPMERVGQGIDKLTVPVRDGLDRVDNTVRGAVDNLGDRTRRLIDDVSRPLAQPRSPETRLPAASTSAGLPAAPPWNAAAPGAESVGSSANASGVNNWNDGPAPGYGQSDGGAFSSDNERGGPVVANPPGGVSQPPSGSESDWNSVASPTGRPGAVAPGDRGQLPAVGTDPFAGVTNPRLRRPNPADASASRDTGSSSAGTSRGTKSVFGGDSAPWQYESPAPPNLDNAGAGQFAGASRGSGSALDGTPQNLAVPSIERGMLSQPGERPLDGVNGSPAPFDAQTPRMASLPAQGAGSSRPTAGGTGSPAQGWETGPALAPPASGQQAAASPTAPAGRDHAAAALLAWVLLSSSAAGNLYLFWSYLDVRTKYRTLVRKSARALNRYSPA